MPPGTIALRVPDVVEAKAKLEAAGVQVNEMWDSSVCHGAEFCDPDGNAILLHHRHRPYEQTRCTRRVPAIVVWAASGKALSGFAAMQRAK